jgi:hypothetical protein
MPTDIEMHNDPTIPAVSYTNNILSAMQNLLDPKSVLDSALLIIRIFRGAHSAAASANTIGLLFANCPVAACLHNQVAHMTHDVLLIFNLTELNGSEKDEEVNKAIFDLTDCFAEKEGQRVRDAYVGRVQVLEFVRGVAERGEKGSEEVEEVLRGLEMLSMG